MSSTIDWNVIIGITGLIIGAISLLYTLFVQSRKKSLSYAFTDSPVFTMKERLKYVEVTWSSIPVKNLRIVMIKLRNSGNLPIKETDYSVPITFCPTFDKNSPTGFLTIGEIISAPDASNPEFRVYEVGKNNHRLSLKNMLLNPKDFVVLKILIIDFGGHNPPINITGRIEGIREFKKEPLVLDDRNPVMKFVFVEKKPEKKNDKL